ncbi:MAG TPA: hypothetical protein DCL74_05475 [Succinivibrionaceae bacterium]|nr:hypothetical protein [Succinivibrionaceae bacterium]
MFLTKLLPNTLILSTLFCYSKKRLFEEISENAATLLKTDPAKLIKALILREQYGTTVFFNGIAIPHAVIPDIDNTLAVLSILDAPVQFNSIDADPQSIDIAYTLFISPNDDYLYVEKLLQNLTDTFSNQDLLNSLRLARNEKSKITVLLKQIDAALTSKTMA